MCYCGLCPQYIYICDVLLLATKDVTIKWWVEHTRISIDQGFHHIHAFVTTQQTHLDVDTTLCQVNLGSI